MSFQSPRSFRLPLVALLLALAVLPAWAGEVEDARANDASRVLGEILRIPDDSIPSNLLQDAQAIAVIPNVMKASFVVGGRRGRGLIAIRGSDGTWSHPSFMTLTGGSFGFQAGVQSADVILVFRSKRGVDSIVNGKFTLGADASVAAGPVGRSAQASTDEQLKAVLPAPPIAMRTFAQNDELAVFAEVYDNVAKTPHRVEIKAEVLADDGKVVHTTSDMRKSEELQGATGGYGYTTNIPLTNLAPGRYVLRLTATSLLGKPEPVIREIEFRVQ